MTLVYGAIALFTLCPPCEEARVQLAAGDTASAAEVLVRAVSRALTTRDAAELGVLLAEIAPWEEREWHAKLAARKALELAYLSVPTDPRVLYGHGILLRKEGRRRESYVALGRALQAHERWPGVLTSRELALSHLERGRILEEHVLDFEGFIFEHSRLPINAPQCAGRGTFCMSFAEPRAFNTILAELPTADHRVERDRQEMRASFYAAFRLDPSCDACARGLLAELARRGEWNEFVAVARGHVAAGPGGWPSFFLGLGLLRVGRTREADQAFTNGVRALPEPERLLLEDPRPLTHGILPLAESAGTEAERAFFWQAADPLQITDVNERKLEHLARFALAELWFGAPPVRLRGYETDRGLILIRYGEPHMQRQIARDEATVRSAEALRGQAMGDIDTFLRFHYVAVSGGRWIIWNYGPDAPNFIFEKHLASRRVRHAMQTASENFARNLGRHMPSAFSGFQVQPVKHQVARFRGADAGLVDVDVYAFVPANLSFRTLAGRGGLFVLPRSVDEPRVEATAPLEFTDEPRIATFRVTLAPGRYPYSVELLPAGDLYRFASRDTVTADAFRSDRLSASDLVLARAVEPRHDDSRTLTRRDFRIDAAPDLTFRSGDPLAVYFELYELAEAVGGGAGYLVELEVRNTAGRLQRVLDNMQDRLTGRGEVRAGTRLRWERWLPVRTTTVSDYLAIGLPDYRPGVYRLSIRITDLASGEQSRRSREFVVE